MYVSLYCIFFFFKFLYLKRFFRRKTLLYESCETLLIHSKKKLKVFLFVYFYLLIYLFSISHQNRNCMSAWLPLTIKFLTSYFRIIVDSHEFTKCGEICTLHSASPNVYT